LRGFFILCLQLNLKYKKARSIKRAFCLCF